MSENTSKKLLIVDDEVQLLTILVDQFTKEGFNVLSAKDAKSGIDLAIKEKPDLMIIDVIMPEMDGLAMLEELRKHPETKEIPAIILSNLSDPQTTAKALKFGVYDHLVKTDWDVADLISRVKEKVGMK